MELVLCSPSSGDSSLLWISCITAFTKSRGNGEMSLACIISPMVATVNIQLENMNLEDGVGNLEVYGRHHI